MWAADSTTTREGGARSLLLGIVPTLRDGPAQPPGPVVAVFLTSLIPSCKNMLSFTDLDEGLGVLSPSCANTGPTPSPFLCFTEL